MTKAPEQIADNALEQFLEQYDITPVEGEHPWTTLGWELGDGGPAYESIRDLVALAVSIDREGNQCAPED